MKFTPEMEQRYNANRLRMNKVNKQFNTYLWIQIALGAVIFGTAFIAGAMSTLDEQQQSADTFSFALAAGFFQILLAIANIVLGWMTSSKKRIPSLLLLILNVTGIIIIATNHNGTFAAPNIFFLVAGLGVNGWIQTVFNENDLLQEEPGYPLFSVNADQRAHYEAPLYVQKAKPSGEMTGVSLPEPAVNLEKPAQEASLFSTVPEVKLPPEVKLSKVTESSLGITDMPGAAGSTAQPAVQLQKPVNANLSELRTDLGSMQNVPQLSSDVQLADMTALPSHATSQGDPSLLPSPEEVRQRLAAMKQARETHHPESGMQSGQ